MKLFDTFEAVKFPEEDMIFITRGGYLYYIYNSEYKWWRKHTEEVTMNLSEKLKLFLAVERESPTALIKAHRALIKK